MNQSLGKLIVTVSFLNGDSIAHTYTIPNTTLEEAKKVISTRLTDVTKFSGLLFFEAETASTDEHMMTAYRLEAVRGFGITFVGATEWKEALKKSMKDKMGFIKS